MVELDKKLGEIVDPYGYGGEGYGVRKAKQIKQAFKDAGWVGPVEFHATGFSAKSPKRRSSVEFLMTGQEWYDKFEKELNTYAWSFDEKNSILVAAKKAAGMTPRE